MIIDHIIFMITGVSIPRYFPIIKLTKNSSSWAYFMENSHFKAYFMKNLNLTSLVTDPKAIPSSSMYEQR